MLAIPYEYQPMEALSVTSLPEGKDWRFEPKWDGFRCLAFKDGSNVALRSRNSKPLERYFPELVEEFRSISAQRFVLDGEIVVPELKGFSFDRLLERIHPAASRIEKLSSATPALFIAFDILIDDGGSVVVDKPMGSRRKKLEKFAARYFSSTNRINLSPSTDDWKVIDNWKRIFGGRLDGIIAKRADLPYESGNRTGMVKIKNLRSADCVIGGFRWAKSGQVPGSLLLGLFDTEGLLHHVGFCSAFTQQEKEQLKKLVVPLRGPSGFSGTSPGGPSRWNPGKEDLWEPLKLKLVGEFRYDHFSDGRFRHGTKFMRWRPDKDPRQCTFDQISL